MNDLDGYVLDQLAFAFKELIGQANTSTWTPTGNGVTLTVNGTCKYLRIGPLVIAQYDVTWPATADVSAAQIKGLPFTSASNGTYQHRPGGNTATVHNAQIAASTSLISILGATEGAVTNANLSTLHLAGVALYFA